MRCCAIGLFFSVVLLVVPANWKPLYLGRSIRDYGQVLALTTRERGFAARGLVWGHYTAVYANSDEKLLDPMRRNWAIAQTQPAQPRLNSQRLMWDDWPTGSWNMPNGVAVSNIGEYVCLPYSAMVIGFAIPLVWWGLRKMNAKR